MQRGPLTSWHHVFYLISPLVTESPRSPVSSQLTGHDAPCLSPSNWCSVGYLTASATCSTSFLHSSLSLLALQSAVNLLYTMHCVCPLLTDAARATYQLASRVLPHFCTRQWSPSLFSRQLIKPSTSKPCLLRTSGFLPAPCQSLGVFYVA
jgi:hypothetical protein